MIIISHSSIFKILTRLPKFPSLIQLFNFNFSSLKCKYISSYCIHYISYFIIIYTTSFTLILNLVSESVGSWIWNGWSINLRWLFHIEKKSIFLENLFVWTLFQSFHVWNLYLTVWFLLFLLTSFPMTLHLGDYANWKFIFYIICVT